MGYTELTNKNVKCHKKHRCGWCNEPIQPKEIAWYRVYIYDGDFISEHQHLECKDALKRSWEAVFADDGYEHGAQKRGVCLECCHYGTDITHTECLKEA